MRMKLGQVFLRPLALGGVAEESNQACSAVNDNRGCVDVSVENGSVFPEAGKVHGERFLSPRLGFELGRNVRQSVLRVNIR